MFIRQFFAALTALLISATLVDTAQAYPTTARSGTTTVTGTYRPLELNLNLQPWVEGPGEIVYTSELYYGYGEGGSYLSLNAVFTGTYRTIGDSTPVDSAPLTGDAGYWQYSLYVYDGEGGLSIDQEGNNIEVSANDAGLLFGALTYLGGGSFDGVPYADTPQTANDKYVDGVAEDDQLGSDWFQYYTTVAGVVMRITSSNPYGSDFSLAFVQDIQHLGPFGSPLDTTRTNSACFDSNNVPIPCGNVTLSASGVPEPASLALAGLGLAALAFTRRNQRQRRR